MNHNMRRLRYLYPALYVCLQYPDERRDKCLAVQPSFAREFLSAAKFDCSTGTASDMQKDAQSQHTNQRLPERRELMKAAVGRSMAATQKNTKMDYDKNFPRETNVRAGDIVYLDCPQHSAIESDLADAFARNAYNSLLQRTSEP